MKPKQILKIITDIAMTVILLLLMAYSLVGEAAHEWLGIGMFVLFILHHVLNAKWSKSLFKGKYTSYRIMQTACRKKRIAKCDLSAVCPLSGQTLTKRQNISFVVTYGRMAYL